MNWVYSARTEKPRQTLVTGPRAGSEAKSLQVGRSQVVLAVFTAEVDVRLSQKISTELYRSTKKNPPRTLKYELIYVCPPLHLYLRY